MVSAASHTHYSVGVRGGRPRVALLLLLLSCIPVWTTAVSGPDPVESDNDLTPTLIAPEIGVSGDVVIQAGGNTTVDCFGNAPLQWSWEPSKNSKKVDYIFSVKSDDQTVLENGMYKRTLRFTNAQFFDTGVYYCVYINNSRTGVIDTTALPVQVGAPVCGGPVSSRKKPTGPSVSVFVSDIKNMFIEKPLFRIHMLSICYGHEAVLPCAVSDPAFNVSLKSANGLMDFTHSQEVAFDPVQGFIISSPYYIHAGSFKCIAQTIGADGNVIEQSIHLALMYQDTQLLPSPQLKPSAFKLLIGESFNLTCIIKVKPGTYVELYMLYKQKGTPAQKRVVVGLPVRRRKQLKDKVNVEYEEVTLLLEVDNATVEDSGEYSCKAVGVHSCPQCNDNERLSKIQITVASEPYLHLKPAQEAYTVNASDLAFMFVAVDAYPVPELQWFHNGHLLRNSRSHQIRQSHRGISLLIIGLTSSDSGVYTLHASTPGRNASANITLYVYGSPVVTLHAMKERMVFQVNTQAKLFCRVASLPATKVTWFFQPVMPGNFTKKAAEWEPVDRSMWEQNVSTPSSITPKSYTLTTTENRTGWYRCVANSQQGRDHYDIEYIVADDEEALTIQIRAVRKVVKGDPLHIVCHANLWMYRSLSISRLQPGSNVSGIMADGDGNFPLDASYMLVNASADVGDTAAQSASEHTFYTVTHSRTPYSLEVTAFFDKLDEEDVGWYACQATNFNNITETKIHQLHLADIHPPVIKQYSQGEQRVSELSSVTLMCVVQGFPPPKVVWYKDDSILNVSLPEDGSLTLDNVTQENAGSYHCSAMNYGGNVMSQKTVLHVGEGTKAASFSSVYVGIVVGVLIFIVIIAAVIVLVIRRKSVPVTRTTVEF